jgi:translation initiation factor 2B subunit (eIF-2B alpha/beta/delta family)
MLVTAAKAYNIPVIAISRSYCLSETLIFNQKSLVLYENPLNNFEKESDFKVLISKKFDIIHSKYIYSIVSESKKWERQNIT